MSFRQEYGYFQLGWSELGVPPFPFVIATLTDGIVQAAGTQGIVQAGVQRNGVVMASVQRKGSVSYRPASEDGILVGSI